MRSPLELEASWARERLLKEAESARLAKAARVPTVPIRARVARGLYALADWLNSEAPRHLEPA